MPDRPELTVLWLSAHSCYSSITPNRSRTDGLAERLVTTLRACQEGSFLRVQVAEADGDFRRGARRFASGDDSDPGGTCGLRTREAPPSGLSRRMRAPFRHSQADLD